jgi:hypothetical protein
LISGRQGFLRTSGHRTRPRWSSSNTLASSTTLPGAAQHVLPRDEEPGRSHRAQRPRADAGELAAASPGIRARLTGHSFGARLVSYSLPGLPSAASSANKPSTASSRASSTCSTPRRHQGQTVAVQRSPQRYPASGSGLAGGRRPALTPAGARELVPGPAPPPGGPDAQASPRRYAPCGFVASAPNLLYIGWRSRCGMAI